VKKITDGFTKFCVFSAILGALALLIITVATVTDVILRAFFATGLVGATEIVTAFLTAVVYFGVGYCTVKRGMIVVELIKVPPAVEYINQILCMIMGGVIIYAVTTQAVFSHATGVGSLRLGIPKWPFMIITSFGYLMMICAMLINLCNDIRDRRAAKKALPVSAPQPLAEGGRTE
jgi:TRAP-type C4-dicarboxylate transport system permease small subunit